MKYIKTFEQKKHKETLNIGKPKVGNYIIYKDSKKSTCEVDILFDEFVANNIGKIYKKRKFASNLTTGEGSGYLVEYDNIPKKIKDYFHTETDNFNEPLIREAKKDEIIYWSKNKEDIEMILAAKKYNIV